MAKIAVIGSGIAGLSAAFLLSQNHDVTLYERENRPGGHSRTVDVNYGDRTIPVDTGFIVFNERNYPNLTALFRYLDVPVQASNMSFALSAEDGWLEWGAENFNAIFAQRRNLLRPKFLHLFAEVMRFNRAALATALLHPEMTVGEFLDHLRLGSWFRDYYLLPLASAIWSTPASQILDYPARSLIQFFENHSLLSMGGQPQWLTVKGGARVYVYKLVGQLGRRAKIGCGVAQVKRSPNGIQVWDGGGSSQNFEQVVFGCHADEALKLLNDATDEERDVLGSIAYQPNLAVLHSDESFMPRRKACWSSWVYSCPRDTVAGAPSVTYWMNRLQNIDPAFPLFVTLNPHRSINPAKIFDSFECSHPVMDRTAMAAQTQLWAMQGQRQTWFCGAYLGHGFHEDGLVSAMRVADSLGAPAPWRANETIDERHYAHASSAAGVSIAQAAALAVQTRAV